MSNWPILDGVEQLQRESGLLLGDDGHKYRAVMTETFTRVSQTGAYGGEMQALVIDDEFIYVGGFTTQTIQKYKRSDCSYVAQSESYGAGLRALAADNDYIYAGGDGPTYTIRKYLKSSLALVGESASNGTSIYALAIDDEFVYTGGWSQPKIRKYRKSDLSLVAESPLFNSGNTIISTLVVDDTHIYIGGETNSLGVCKYSKSSLALVGESPKLNTTILCLAVDETRVYAGGQLYALRSFDKGSLAVHTARMMTSGIYSLAVTESNLYVGEQGRVHNLNKDDLSSITEPVSTVTPYAMAAADIYCFAAMGNGADTVHKYERRWTVSHYRRVSL